MPGTSTRRVVTGHDAGGRSIVAKDSTISGDRGALVWTTDTFPVNNLDLLDGGERQLSIALKGGTVCWVLEIQPGAQPFMHRTKSVDYVAVLDGEVDLLLDGGETVHLSAGDLVVQRGTNHAWVNKGAGICRLLAVLIDALPVEIDGRVLETIE